MARPQRRASATVAAGEEGQTIRVVSRLTGIPVDTLRVWERRYDFPRPSRRTGSNRRLYADEDVDRLQWVARALKQGYRAGDVIRKSAAELRGLLAQSRPDGERGFGTTASPVSVDRLVEILAADDLRAVEEALRLGAAALGPRRFVTDLAHPLAVAVGESWAQGKLHVRQEHAASQVLRTQVRSMLAAYVDLEARPVVLLTTLSGEPHDLGLEMVALVLAVSGAKPRLLGAGTPPAEIVDAVRALNADVVGLTVTKAVPTADCRRGVQELVRNLPRRVPVWIGGVDAAVELASDSVRLVRSWNDLDEALRQVRGEAARPG